MTPSVQSVPIRRVVDGNACDEMDCLALEEPLEIRLGYHQDGRPVRRSVSVTMRTPGHDRELAAGFLFTEGILHDPAEIAAIRACGRADAATGFRNIVRVELRADVAVNLTKIERNFYTTSSCGICGKSSLEAVAAHCEPLPPNDFMLSADTLYRLPDALRTVQSVFERTGGLHAAALYDADGTFRAVYEDVGRHNAVDKLIGAEWLAGNVPLSRSVLMVSGRAGFELVQKAAVARIPVMAAVGAPSSLSVALAEQTGMTLVGFLRERRFNIYTGNQRITTQG